MCFFRFFQKELSKNFLQPTKNYYNRFLRVPEILQPELQLKGMRKISSFLTQKIQYRSGQVLWTRNKVRYGPWIWQTNFATAGIWGFSEAYHTFRQAEIFLQIQQLKLGLFSGIFFYLNIFLWDSDYVEILPYGC